MSFNAKTIAVSAAVLLTAAGGLYAFMPDRETAPKNRASVSSTRTIAEAKPESPQAGANGPNVAEAKGADATVAAQPGAAEQPASQAPKKLTRAQLTPPPATEEEKLQKAAEQESNF